MQTIAAAVTVCTGIYLAACIALVGRKLPRYRQVWHTISELGEAGTRFL